MIPAVLDHDLACRRRFCFQSPVAIAGTAKARHGNFSWRAWIDLTKLEFHAHVRLKELILIKRIDLDIAETASTKTTIDAP